MTPGFVGATGQDRTSGSFATGPAELGTIPGLIRESGDPGPSTPPVTDGLEAHYSSRLESFADGDSVGTLTDQQNANDLTQSTSSQKPTYRDNGADNIDGREVTESDGSDDFVDSTDFITSTSGEIILVCRIVTARTFDTYFEARDSSDSDVRIFFQMNGDSTPKLQLNVQDGSGDTADEVEGSTGLSDGEVRMLGWRSDGSSYSLRVDGSDETLTVNSGTNSGRWIGDLSSDDTHAMFARATGSQHIPIELGDFFIWSRELTSHERTSMEDWLNDDVGYSVF